MNEKHNFFLGIWVGMFVCGYFSIFMDIEYIPPFFMAFGLGGILITLIYNSQKESSKTEELK